MINFFKSVFGVFKVLTITLGSIFVILVVLAVCGVVGLMFGARSKMNVADAIKSDRQVAVVSVADEIGRNIKADEFHKQLTAQLKDKDIKGVVVRIDSPGGAVGESEEMYLSIKNATKVEGHKPIVCSLGNLAASGALYISAACDRVVTLRGTITGSIGVIMMSPNFSSIMQKYDVEMNVIKSGQFKDAGSPFRAMTEDDKTVLTKLVNQAFEQFVSAISESRHMAREDVLKIADGRIILGEEAVTLGLADSIGNINTAAQTVLDILKLDGEPELVYQKKNKLFAFLENFADSKVGSWFWNKRVGIELKYQMY